MTAEIAHFPTVRVGDHVIRQESRYSRLGLIEVMVGRIVAPDTPQFALYLRLPGRENVLLATVTSSDPELAHTHIDHIWQAVERTLFIARLHSDQLLADVPEPWGTGL